LRIAAVNHLLDILKNGVTYCNAGGYNGLKMVFKDFLDDSHTVILTDKLAKSNTPHE
jgi:hypothetical protein